MLETSLSVVFLESFYGGSHKEFADCLRRHSRHVMELLTLPDENWGWRMRWSARHFAALLLNRGTDTKPYDLIMATDLINIADLHSMLGTRLPRVPLLLYMHESQLRYPRSDGKTPPIEHALTDIKNVLSAELTLFNSAFHRDSFLQEAARVLGSIPGFETGRELDALHQNSRVCYPGFERMPGMRPARGAGPPVIVWNHRWEPDKQPALFGRVLERLEEGGTEFRLILLGEQPLGAHNNPPGRQDPVFESLCERFRPQILHAGYTADREQYFRLLRQGDIVLSTALQENFGLSMLQAVDAGCIPLAPKRLAYPEVLPDSVHTACLYNGTQDLLRKLARLCSMDADPEGQAEKCRLQDALSKGSAEFRWESRAPEFDRLLADLVLG